MANNSNNTAPVIVQQEREESNYTDNEPDYILSLCWFNGKLGAVYYNLESCELSIVYEIVDVRPDLTYTQNLLRQLCPAYILYSGSPPFNADFKKILDLPEEMNDRLIRKKRDQPPNRSNVIMSVYNKNDVSKAKSRVLRLKPPGLATNATDFERGFFFKNVFPMEEDLVIQSLGNLLEYVELHLSSFWQMGSLIISDVLTCRLENQVLIDTSSFYGLHIFTSIDRFGPRSEFNLFNVLNQCSSYSGTMELKKMMMQPTRNIEELNKRLATVEWCRQSESFEFTNSLRDHCRRIRNLTTSYKKIISTLGKPVDFKSFKRSIYHAFQIGQEAIQLSRDEIKGTYIMDLVHAVAEDQTIRQTLFSIDRVVDLEASEIENEFCVKVGVDPKLDEKRQLMASIKDEVYNETLDVEQMQIPGFAQDYYIAFMPGLGFLVAVELNQELSDVSLNTTTGEAINIIYQKDNVIYFKTKYCEEMTNSYGELNGEITFMQLKIFERLIRLIGESLPELVEINRLCAKIDVMIAFASVAIQRGYVKPVLTTDKRLLIKNGRHPLVEATCTFTTNTTDVSVEQKNLITIITAPNASGKSVYLRQIGLICFMAHIGCFVPADEAVISLLDTIYTRIYSTDTFGSGESPHMTDMRQMARIVKHSTSKSLALIDEFGKGTDEEEGQCWLAGCLNYLAEYKESAPITFVTTHYTIILRLIMETEYICLKTIRTQMSARGYLPLYEIVDGVDEVPWYTTPEEVSDLLDKVLSKNPTVGEKDLNVLYDVTTTAQLSLVHEAIRQIRETGDIDEKVLLEMYNEMDLNDILDATKQTLEDSSRLKQTTTNLNLDTTNNDNS